MELERTIARDLIKNIPEDLLGLDDFQLGTCTQMVKEAAAQAYLTHASPEEQIDVLIDALQDIQASEDKEAIASTFFGSPLHGMMTLRAVLTKHIIEIIEDDINDCITDIAEENALSASEDHAYEMAREAAL